MKELLAFYCIFYYCYHTLFQLPRRTAIKQWVEVNLKPTTWMHHPLGQVPPPSLFFSPFIPSLSLSRAFHSAIVHFIVCFSQVSSWYFSLFCCVWATFALVKFLVTFYIWELTLACFIAFLRILLRFFSFGRSFSTFVLVTETQGITGPCYNLPGEQSFFVSRDTCPLIPL